MQPRKWSQAVSPTTQAPTLHQIPAPSRGMSSPAAAAAGVTHWRKHSSGLSAYLRARVLAREGASLLNAAV